MPTGRPTKVLLKAAWVAPISRPTVRDAGVVFSSDITLAVGDARTLAAAHPDAVVHDYGASVILPGLVNAHTHLELSDLSPGERPASFAAWLIRLIKNALPEDGADATRRIEAAMREGVRQCLRFGVTAVGDITRLPGLTRPALNSGALRAVSYGEVRAMGARRRLLAQRLEAACDRSAQTFRVTVGVSPHAPYTVEPEGYRGCLAQLVRRTTHLAESADEARFLAEHSGPLREVWDFIGGFDDQVPRFRGGPIRFAQSLGMVGHPFTFAHVNYCDDDELDILSAGRANVVYCPRTHAYFGHPPHRWREMLSRSINVALGTDSSASSPDLNLVDDLRIVRRLAPDLHPRTLWRMVTVRAARALHEHHLGYLAGGTPADCVVFPVQTDDPLGEILDRDVLPTATWISGRPAWPLTQR